MIFDFKKLVFVFSIALLTSCQNEPIGDLAQNNQLVTTPFNENFGEVITGSIIGHVVNQSGQPVNGALVRIGEETVTTDVNGVFVLRDVYMNERFGYLTVEKMGFMKGSRAFVPVTGTNELKIMLLTSNAVATIASGQAETVTLPNGASVLFDGDFSTDAGLAYDGMVNVSMHYLNPNDLDIMTQMPGMLYAQNAMNQEQVLQTFGMMAVELTGASGEVIQLAEGSTAEMSLPVDENLQADAPSTIKLWHFDDVNGYWIEEGEANLINGSYVGLVSHFSFWNCDVSLDAISLCVLAADNQGNPLSNMNVVLTTPAGNMSSGYTNADGEVCGYVPGNTILELSVLDAYNCESAPLYTQSIGPFIVDATTNVIVPTGNSQVAETVVGFFNDCNGNPVTTGYVGLNYQGLEYYATVTNGAFEISLLRCDNNVTFNLNAVDFSSLQSSGEINYTFSTSYTDIGEISACNAIAEFAYYQIDGGNASYFVPPFNVNFAIGTPNSSGFDILTIYGSDQSGTSADCLYIYSHLDPSLTNFQGAYNVIDWGSSLPGFMPFECFDASPVNNNIIFNLTHFGGVGEYVDINYSGDYFDNAGNPHTINGIIHVLRDD